MMDYGTMEKKLNELMESDARMQNELEDVKAERDRKIIEYQRLLEKEKETQKQKMHDIEIKYKESENKRSTQLFEFEKERARWALDRDHLVN
jgi:hypothetical protein